MPQAPDGYVNSSVDVDTGEVAALEGLVGCHGSLGGVHDLGTSSGTTGYRHSRNGRGPFSLV
jgi:hypothetical protein